MAMKTSLHASKMEHVSWAHRRKSIVPTDACLLEVSPTSKPLQWLVQEQRPESLVIVLEGITEAVHHI
jgi:hypothetical protein